MRKYGIGSRILTALLVMAMVVSMIPTSIFGAIGDMAVGTVAGVTGLDGDVNPKDTISWPIKIYDYLNDGMLFEYANAGDSGDISDVVGGAYGGGTPAPHFGDSTSPQLIIGNDYTLHSGASGSPFNEDAFTYIGKYGSGTAYPNKNLDTSDEGAVEVKYSEVEAKNWVDPGYMHLAYDSSKDLNSDSTKSYVWVSNFARDNNQYYTGEQVQYAVIVYRTNDTYTNHTARFYWAVSDSSYSTDYTYHTSTLGNSDIDITNLRTTTGYGTLNTGYNFTVPKSTEWRYLVVNMKYDTDSITNRVDQYWDNFGTKERVAGIGLGFPLCKEGETMDVTHIAYFRSEFEATQFGTDAVAFNNDPGEYLNSHKEYDSDGNPAPTNSTDKVLDFTVSGTGGYSSSVYTQWGTDGMSRVVNGNYVNITCSDSDPDNSYVFLSSSGVSKSSVRYVTVVYRTYGITSPKVGFWIESPTSVNFGSYTSNLAGYGFRSDTTSLAKLQQSITASSTDWKYFVYDLNQIANADSDYNSFSQVKNIGIYFPGFTSGSQSMDIAYIDFFSDSSDANSFGASAVAYMTDPAGYYTTTQKKWNTGNNVAFSMLYGNQGGYWSSETDGVNIGGGANTLFTDYYSYGIGQTGWSGTTATVYNGYRTTAKGKGYPVSNQIWLLNSWSMIEDGEATYDMSQLDLGYQLFNYLSSGVMTAGLLKSSLTTITANGKTYRVPDYKAETVEYIAYLLRDSLRVPRTDSNGNYNYCYVQGTANADQYGTSTDAKYGKAAGAANDLASALRARLGVNVTTGANMGTASADVGSYAALSDADKAALIGKFSDVKGEINTFVDAAYFLLMNLYVEDSYNQTQDEYNYLVLSNGTLSDTKQNAYIFDGGFTTGIASNTANTDEYRASSNSGVVYDKTLGTISLQSGLSKDKIYFGSESTTTRFPFLPVTDATGIYAGETKSPYFLDDGRGVMGITEEGGTFVNRNYNFALASNGEFVYHYDEDLFFQFEGDDDVYLFINGELVLDIGAAHSITSVSMTVNEYVDWARKVLANQSDYTATEIARAEKLNLIDGEKYTFDFYYMERHGWGSNCRIATNIVVTDPALDTNKQGYQGTDINGNPEEVLYGGIIDINDRIGYSFSITNEGETKLYKLGFEDADIGINLTYDGGLQIYGAATNATFTTTAANTTLTISGLNGIVNLDGSTYLVTTDEAKEITVADAGTHTLVLYQLNNGGDPTHWNPLFTDAAVTVQLGTSTTAVTPTATDGVYALSEGANALTVAGIRVSDKNGGHLELNDLIITVDGFKPEEDEDGNRIEPYNLIATPTYTIELEKKVTEGTTTVMDHASNQADLKSFLTTLVDPAGDTGTGETADLYSGSGLWHKATVKIAGFYYTMTEAQKEANRFTNTVYTSGYNHIDSEAPSKSQDRHRVYGLGSYEYYQWASHTVHLDLNTMWTDVINVYTRPDDSLYEQRDQIEELNKAGLSTLQVEVTDKNGVALKDTYNLYANETWGTYEPTDADKTKLADIMDKWDENTAGYAADMDHIFYFQKDAPEEDETVSWNQNWENVWVYYWSDANTGLTTWPGKQMYQLNDTTWCYFLHPEAENVVFSNGSGGYNNQTGDLTLPETAFTAVDWNDTNDVLEVTYKTSGRHIFYVKVTSSNPTYYQQVIVPIVFYVADVKDNYFVLDYGLKTDNITTDVLLKNDDFLANYGLTNAEFVGYLSNANNPRYLGTYSTAAFNLKNLNRVAYDGSPVTDSSIAVNDGTFNIGTTAASAITYAVTNGVGSYSMPSGYTVSFTPNKIMDEEYSMYMAFRVYNKVTETLVDGEKVETTYTPNAIGDENVTGAIDHVIDIHNEVQMYKKITTLPATVVYYEDDFADITYTKNYGTFTQLGTVSTNLTQGINAQTPYGQDSAYQGSANEEMSGNTLTGIKLTDKEHQGVVASFGFTGTGFEIISRTNSYDSASMVVNIYSAALDTDGNVVKADTDNDGKPDLLNKLPVITEFTNVEGNVCQHADHTTEGACKTCGINVAHSYVEGIGSTMYYFTVNGKPENFIFNNGNGGSAHQTENLSYNSETVGQWIELKNQEKTVLGKYMVVDSDNSRTFYVNLTNDVWGSVCLHAWGNDGANYTGGSWPGATMSLAYYCTLSESVSNVIFNNGSGGDQNQTADMTLEADGAWHPVTSKIGAPVGHYLAESTTTDGQRNVYFASAGIWSAVSIYTWDTDETGSWPGKTISKSCSVCGAAYKETKGYYLIDATKEDALKEYKFSGNQLAVSFTRDTYVRVRSSDGTVYQTSGYPGDDAISAVMYVNPAYADKLRVPANVEVIFTVVENADGSITLSYITDPNSGKPTTVGEDGKVMYYDNTYTNWDKVYVHFWSDENQNMTTWGQNEMTKESGNLYSFTIPQGAQYVIFHNNAGSQTADLRILSNANCYSFDMDSNTADKGFYQLSTTVSSGYEIYQVPVIRVDSMPYGTYFVEIEGLPTMDFSNMTFDPATGDVNGVTVVPTVLYIDGIRIFQPLNDYNETLNGYVNGSDIHYYEYEDMATFTELRDMILDGNAAVGVFDATDKIYTGNKSWTENRNGELYLPDSAAVKYVGNMVTSVDQYMLVGPNNEVYLNGINTNQSVVFYVAEEAVTYHTVQIAARAIDAGLFLNGQASGTGAILYQGVKSGNSYAWKGIASIQSSTEQYYTIDYAACPTVTIDGKNYYQVALHVSGGMVSLSTVKLVGMTIAENDIGDATSLSYMGNGMLENYETETATEQTEKASMVWNLFSISRQMEATEGLDANDGGNSGNGGSNDSNANTGDVSVLIPAGLMIMALMCLAFVATRKKVF